MKQFLDTIEDNLCLLDSNKQLLYLNQESLKTLGYKGMTWEQAREIATIQIESTGTVLHSYTSKGEWIDGVVKLFGEEIDGEKCFLGKIQWQGRISKNHKFELMEDFLDHLNQSVCIKDKDGTYVLVNRHYADRMGTTKDEMIGKIDADYWDEDYCKQFKQDDEYVLATNKECVIEEEVKNENKHFETTKFPVQSQDRYVGVIIKDMTLQKIFHKEVLEYVQVPNDKEDEEGSNLGEHFYRIKQMVYSLREYLGTQSVNVWLYNEKEEHITPCFKNEKIDSLLGGSTNLPMSKQQVENIKYKKEVVIKTNHLPFSGKIGEVNEDEPIFYVMYYPIVYDDTFLGVLNVVHEEDPKIFVAKHYFMKVICKKIGLILNTHKLSANLREAEIQRMKAQEELEIIVESVADLIVALDLEGHFLKVNEGCKKILGWTEKELLQMQWHDIIHPDDYEETKERIVQWEMGIERIPMTNRYQCKDGSYKWLRWEGYYRKDTHTVIITAKNITPEIELQQREGMAKEQMHIEKLRNEFFANLSHEFKTPLTIILAGIQMLSNLVQEENMEREVFVKYIGRIKQNSYRLLRLVNNIIDVTKIDTGYYELQIQNCNIIYVVEEIVMSVAEYARDKEIEIIFDTEVEEEVIACDPDKIERIILNLLSNAIKYTLGKGKIKVSMTLEERDVVIVVQDNGVGIPQEKLPYVFDRFMQVNDVLTKHCEGSGIGLSLVKALVTLHGGSIHVKSILGKGSCFEVRLQRMQTEEVSNLLHVESAQANRNRIEKCYIEFSDIYSI